MAPTMRPEPCPALASLMCAGPLLAAVGTAAATASTCTHNLTEPAYYFNASLQGGSSQYLQGQGTGWLEGDFSSTAFVNVPNASLLLRLNSSASTLPALGVDISWRGQDASKFAPMHVAAGKLPALLSFAIAAWPDGEFAALIVPDAASVARGWCGGLVRFLRKGTEPVTPSLQCVWGSSEPCAPLRLPPGQPMLLLDDLWIWSRLGAARRLIPGEQMRLGNSSWWASLRRSPKTGDRFPWIDDDQSHPLRVGSDQKSLVLGVKVNWATNTDPHHDPNSSIYACTGAVDWNPSSGTGSEQVSWACEENNATALQRFTCEINPANGKKACVVTDSGTMDKTECESACKYAPSTAQHEHELVDAPKWPPPHLNDWAIQDAEVRWYDAAVDGPVDVSALFIYYTYGVHYKFPEVIGNVSFPALSGTPVWRRHTPNGTKLAVVLPVDGKRQPLIYAESNPDQINGSKDHCNSMVMGRPSGPNSSDPHCVNDNFGGSWRTPPMNVSGVTIPTSFTYVQARRVPAFAPKVAPYDNLNTIRRILVRFITTDGLYATSFALIRATNGVGSPL